MRILKKGLKITFINPNTEEQIVQAMSGVLSYNLAENDNKIIFDYNSNAYQNSHSMEEELGNVKKCIINMEETNKIWYNGKKYEVIKI